ncbi:MULTISPECIES: NAD(P)/FAD-dependent oxidoreductase [unclassified Halomonas]|jgi:putative flavoprotein involved in K+ transport|uniref:NAD(P)/FAD-dependent oxidoreductase n=1 Tax=unclassified Halomonas TaxID=2609666 RepID=UPI00028A3643|nr:MULTISPECIES: NAD(P)/FAD-dependent oxidoreductase [unclassified Halomonas]MCE8039555.1 NAD(P)-binding domain-containing protein [Halomonas sp. MCCC 1A11062]
MHDLEQETKADVPWVDAVIVGAGPAGIGMALALEKLVDIEYVVLEAEEIGASFRRWPVQTRFITPSFHSNPFGLADLNAINEISSPAILAGAEHLSGEQYAHYLNFIAQAHELPISEGCKVYRAEALEQGGFWLDTGQGELRTRYLIWATGEYQFPDLTPFPGAQWCVHYARVSDWAELSDRQECTASVDPSCPFTVIGGYESGVDAAINLVRLGHHVRLLARKSSWLREGPYDPSLSLSPYSRERLVEALKSERLDIVFGIDVVEVARDDKGGFRIHAADGSHWDTAQPPVLGTGFHKGGGARQVAELWHWTEEGHVALTEGDESTRTPGLFLVGPQVRHDQRIYCFIYKFRQRFGLVAEQIAERMELDASALQSGAGAWGPFGNSDCCEDCEC